MRTSRRALLLGLFLMAASPTSARAAGLFALFDYLDHLSGPGPFKGAGVGLVLLCDDGADRLLPGCLWKTGGITTQGTRVTPRRFEIGPHVSWLKGVVNPALEYPAGTSDEAKRVDAFTYGAHAYLWGWRFNGTPQSAAVGAAVRVTRVRFTGDLVPDGSITRTLLGIGPVVAFPLVHGFRIDVNPQLLLGLGTFKPGDFGALGPALEPDSVKWTVQVTVRL